MRAQVNVQSDTDTENQVEKLGKVVAGLQVTVRPSRERFPLGQRGSTPLLFLSFRFVVVVVVLFHFGKVFFCARESRAAHVVRVAITGTQPFAFISRNGNRCYTCFHSDLACRVELRGFNGISPGRNGLYWVLLFFFQVLLGLTGLNRVFIRFKWAYWVLMDFTGFY